MPVKRVNPRLVKLHRSYTVSDIALTLGVHKNSVRGWQHAGLKPLDRSRPLLFQGQALREFLEARRAKAGAATLPPDTLPRGDSTPTRMTKRGWSTGTMPTKLA